jgi:hypothetical protein
VQLPPPLKLPLSVLKLTVPVGVVAGAPTTTSVTVAVQLIVPPTGTVAGLQPTIVVVACLPVTVSVKVPTLELIGTLLPPGPWPTRVPPE